MKIEYLKGSNIISLKPARLQAKFPAIAQVEAYWEGLRNGRPMPARAEVDPRGISEVLEYAFVLEKVAPGMARLRVAGRHLADLLGMEVRGMPLSAMFLPEARKQLARAMETAFTSPASIRMTLKGDTGFTRPALEAQMFLAPLRDEEGRPTRMLGALQSTGKIGRAPRRFAIREMDVNTLLGEAGAMPPPAAKPRAARTSRDAIPGLAEYATGLAAAPRRPGKTRLGAPHLELVYSADDKGV